MATPILMVLLGLFLAWASAQTYVDRKNFLDVLLSLVLAWIGQANILLGLLALSPYTSTIWLP